MKTGIVRNRDFLDWLRDQPCAVSGSVYPDGGREPAHTFKTTGGGGIGLKSTDKYALPLSHAEHQKQSRMSEVQYWRNILIGRPVLRDKMLMAYSMLHTERRNIDWKEQLALVDDIRTDNTLVKHLIQSFAEVHYYNRFLRGDT